MQREYGGEKRHKRQKRKLGAPKRRPSLHKYSPSEASPDHKSAPEAYRKAKLRETQGVRRSNHQSFNKSSNENAVHQSILWQILQLSISDTILLFILSIADPPRSLKLSRHPDRRHRQSKHPSPLAMHAVFSVF